MTTRKAAPAAVALLVRRLGLRSALRHPLRTVLTATGVAAAVALVFAVQVMNTTLNTAVTGLPDVLAGGNRLVIAAPSSRGLDADVVDSVRETEDVSTAAPLLFSRTEVGGTGGTEAVLVAGVTGDLLALDTGSAPPRLSGDFGADGHGVALPAALARRLGVGVGSAVEVAAPRGRTTLPVTGTIESGDLEQVNAGAVAVMELGAAQELFGRAGRVDMVVVEWDGASSRAELERHLEARLRGDALVGHSVDELSGMANVRPFNGLTTLIGLVALAIAAFVVLNTMGMAVAERRRELSLARVLGATPRDLRRAVLCEALVMGVAATAAGMAAGWFLARFLVSRASRSYEVLLSGAAMGEPLVRPPAVALAVLAGVVVCLAGALLPAWQSFRVAPVEAIRPVAPHGRDAAGDRRPPRLVVAAGVALLAVALAIGVAGDRRSLIVGVAAVVGLLAGAVLVLPAAVRVALRTLRPFSMRVGGPIGRLAVDEMANSARRTSTQVGVLVFSLSLVVGLASTIGAVVTRFNDLAREYISAPIYVEADSAISYVATQPLDRRIGREIAEVPGVSAVLPGQTSYLVVDGHASVLYANPYRSAAEAGVHDRLRDREMAHDPAAFAAGLRRGDIAISSRAREVMGVDVGDDLVLPTPAGGHAFRVAAVYDDIAAVPTVIVDYDVYAERWQDTSAQRFQVMTEPGRDGEALAAVRDLARERGLPVNVYSRSQAIDRNGRNLLRQFELAQAIQWAALILAAVTMAVTFFATVVQRRWQHGMQRLLGMTGRQLGATLLLEAGIAAVLGWTGAGTVGVALGWLMSRAASAGLGASLPLHVPGATLALCLGAAFAVALAGVAYPRWVAVRTAIIDILRSE